MKTNSVNKLGWIVAGVLAGVLFGSGFQGSSEKIAVVDITKVVEQSEFGRQSQQTFERLQQNRYSVLEFLDQYRAFTPEQRKRFKDLSLKENRSAEETAELDRIKAEVVATDKKNRELGIKQDLTREDRILIEDIVRRSQDTERYANDLVREFTAELQGWLDKQKLESLDRARAAIQDVAKAQGYSVVFEVGVAPYGANDLTSESLKAMNAKR
jgi:Skp family chaperone for outer membrane proteins